MGYDEKPKVEVALKENYKKKCRVIHHYAVKYG